MNIVHENTQKEKELKKNKPTSLGYLVDWRRVGCGVIRLLSRLKTSRLWRTWYSCVTLSSCRPAILWSSGWAVHHYSVAVDCCCCCWWWWWWWWRFDCGVDNGTGRRCWYCLWSLCSTRPTSNSRSNSSGDGSSSGGGSRCCGRSCGTWRCGDSRQSSYKDNHQHVLYLLVIHKNT